MNTTQTTTTVKMLEFILAYRYMERSRYATAGSLIQEICEACNRKHLLSHLVNSWRGKQKNFADWFLNLDSDFRYHLLTTFGLLEKGNSEELQFIQKIDTDPQAALFLSMPGLLKHTRKLLIFFYNNAVSHTAIPEYHLSKRPNSKKKFGNSANWGDYILSLSKADQETIIQYILNRKN